MTHQQSTSALHADIEGAKDLHPLSIPPLMEGMMEGCDKDIPRYLYRVYATDSNGYNSTTCFASAAARDGKGHEQLSDIPKKEAKTMLETHFRWLRFKDDEFVSWTSSLLYALQFAVRKTRNKNNPRVVSDECDIKLCILDILAIDRTSFFRASDMLRVYRIPSDDTVRHEYHTTEYLLHGRLDVEGHSMTVSLAELREEGLFDLIPELDNEEKKFDLWRRVNELRRTMVSTDCLISAKDGAMALWIASLFSGSLTMPVMVALLSLRRRDPDDERFLRVLREFADPARDFQVLHADRGFDPVDAPELANFASMMKAGFHEMRRISAERAARFVGLEAAIGGLGLGFDPSAKEEGDGVADEETK